MDNILMISLSYMHASQQCCTRNHSLISSFVLDLLLLTLYASYLQALTHKLPLRKAQPPLARLIRSILIDPCQQSNRQLLSNLHQVLLQHLRILTVRRRLKHLVEREPWVAWDSEVGVECDVLDFFLCLPISLSAIYPSSLS